MTACPRCDSKGRQVKPVTVRAQAVAERLEGMTCAGCEAHVREALEALPGVVAVGVSYGGSSAEVVWSGTSDDQAVSEAIGALGYRAAPQSE